MTPVRSTQEIRTGVPKPENAAIPIRVIARTPRNLRNGPGTEYLDQGDPLREEIYTGDEIIIFDNTTRVATDGKIWKWVEVTKGKYEGRGGWIQITDFKLEKVATQPLPNIIVPLPPEQPIDATPAPVFTVAPPVPQIDPTNVLELPPDTPASAAAPAPANVATETPKAQEAAENEQETIITITSGKDGLVSIVIRPANDRHREFLMTLMETCRVVSNAIVNFGDMKAKTVIEM